MDLGKVQYFEKVENNQQKDFLTAQNNCSLCGNSLELQHIRVQETTEIKEEAHCGHCDLRTRAKTYSLQ
jgi:transcription elongation factor Elf1